MIPTERRAAALGALEQSGLCRMPGSVPYLQPYEVDFVVYLENQSLEQ